MTWGKATAAAAAWPTLIVIFAAYNYVSTCAALMPQDGGLIAVQPCSTTCESSSCLFAPTLRYGKSCGIGYGSCPGQLPCDGLDACCKIHDDCIGSNLCNYLNVTCNQNLITCVNNFVLSGGKQFPGATCNTLEVALTVDSGIELGVKIGEALKIANLC